MQETIASREICKHNKSNQVLCETLIIMTMLGIKS